MKKWKDHYSELAKREGYPARSVYKLKEAQKKYGLIKRGDVVLDLGCSPGSWSKYSSSIVGKEGLVVGIDVSDVEFSAPNFKFLKRDVFEVTVEELSELSPKGYFDVVLSDMAPSTTGDRTVDHFRSLRLAERALELASQLLRPGGNFMVKVFEGERFPKFRTLVSEVFSKIKLFRPKSTRSFSKEIFVLGLDKKRKI